MGKQQGSIDSPPVKELQVVLLEVLNSSEEDFTCSHVCYSFGKTKARITPRLRQESFPLACDAGFRHCRAVVYQNRCFRARGAQNFCGNRYFIRNPIRFSSRGSSHHV